MTTSPLKRLKPDPTKLLVLSIENGMYVASDRAGFYLAEPLSKYADMDDFLRIAVGATRENTKTLIGRDRANGSIYRFVNHYSDGTWEYSKD